MNECLDEVANPNFDKCIGIDYSIASTAMCVKKFNDYSFYWFPKVENKQSIKYWQEIEKIATIIPYATKKTKSNYSNQAIENILNANLLSDIILDCLLGIDKDVPINIEGFSFNSTGASFIDLITYQSIFRSSVIKNDRSFNVFSPTTIKKHFSGSGKSTKDEMCKAFTHYKNTDANLLTLSQLIENCLKDRQNIKKPLDDIVDAYAICNMNNPNKTSITRLQRDKSKVEISKINKNLNLDDLIDNIIT